jgi:hypothetical protein
MSADNQKIIVSGKFIKIASYKDEWLEDIEDPESFIKRLKQNKVKADIFTFWQRLPDTKPKYDYYMEWDNVAALKISSFDHWWNKQIDAKTRNVTRKAEKKGVIIRVAPFNDEFAQGITTIFNETPVRQDKPFWHYGKDFKTIKEEMSDRLERAIFIGAYYNDNLIGFIKLLDAGRYLDIVEILSMIGHRDKAPTNALLAKSVEICADREVPYLVYAHWPRGTLADFKRNNDFERVDLPRYYIPLNIKGSIALKLNIHHRIRDLIPEKLMLRLLDFRQKWYSKK